MKQLSWKTLKQLENKYGDSFYFFDQNRFRSNYLEFLGAFRTHYPNTNIAYSYKTNYLPRLCKIVDDLGGYAEVVSSMEYELARQIGISPRRIIFNGPFKRTDDIIDALTAGSTVNLESAYELDVVTKLAQSNPAQTFSVGLRCNFDLTGAQPSRFGFEANLDTLAPVVKLLTSFENCRVDGLHCHALTPQKSVAGYQELCTKILDLSSHIFQDRPPRFIDLGGGFFSKMSDDLRQQFSYPIPTYNDYGTAIASLFREAFPGENGPELILEPGISLTADIMRFVCRVVDVKKMRNRCLAQLTGSIYNIKPTLNDKNLPVTVVRGNTEAWQGDELLDMAGYTCMEHDILFHGYEGRIGRGDYVIFDNVGAYTIVLKPPFILPSPAILVYDDQSTEFELVKKQECFQDVFASYLFDDSN